LSFELDASLEETSEIVSNTEVFTLAESLGGVESLIEHPAIMTHASMPADMRRELGITDGLVRLSVGIEDVDDLRRDLDRGLEG
ncbi:MAG: PLP-dependent transferase, partial [Bradymonadaceae bacterium]